MKKILTAVALAAVFAGVLGLIVARGDLAFQPCQLQLRDVQPASTGAPPNDVQVCQMHLDAGVHRITMRWSAESIGLAHMDAIADDGSLLWQVRCDVASVIGPCSMKSSIPNEGSYAPVTVDTGGTPAVTRVLGGEYDGQFTLPTGAELSFSVGSSRDLTTCPIPSVCVSSYVREGLFRGTIDGQSEVPEPSSTDTSTGTPSPTGTL